VQKRKPFVFERANGTGRGGSRPQGSTVSARVSARLKALRYQRLSRIALASAERNANDINSLGPRAPFAIDIAA
jgi:hypothetical protein